MSIWNAHMLIIKKYWRELFHIHCRLYIIALCILKWIKRKENLLIWLEFDDIVCYIKYENGSLLFLWVNYEKLLVHFRFPLMRFFFSNFQQISLRMRCKSFFFALTTRQMLEIKKSLDGCMGSNNNGDYLLQKTILSI